MHCSAPSRALRGKQQQRWTCGARKCRCPELVRLQGTWSSPNRTQAQLTTLVTSTSAPRSNSSRTMDSMPAEAAVSNAFRPSCAHAVRSTMRALVERQRCPRTKCGATSHACQEVRVSGTADGQRRDSSQVRPSSPYRRLQYRHLPSGAHQQHRDGTSSAQSAVPWRLTANHGSSEGHAQEPGGGLWRKQESKSDWNGA